MQIEFKNRSNRFRPIPFWSWNDRLDPKELEEQIREMKQSGVGGYFMHARSGLQTEYLSEDWFRCIQTGIEMAKQEDMNAWIYDEEGWPSGFAGGIVPALSRSYQAKFMTMETMDDFTFEDYEEDALDIIAQYDFDADTNTYQRIRMAEADRRSPLLKRLILHRHVNPFYVDTLNKHAIDAFLACTHEAYYERFGEDFGSSVQGFFTDEPRLACNHFGELAWSDELPGVFEQKYGYDILDHLPALYLKTGQYEKYRYDFWSLVNEMFTENYMKNIYDWCEAHHCKATGHIMMEESIFSQMTSSAGVMPFYEYLHIPGIDWLRRMIASPVIAKQVGSVACQLGKKQVLTESFALCGWNVSFEELKWIAEWQFVNGVNQICQHLMAYSIKGSRKRDYPPSFFTQQTWWKESHLFHDYLARLCVALSEGDQMADVLLIHPMKSGYVAYDGTRTEEIRLLDDEFTKISEYLSGAHISYHFGDETILHKYGGVTDGCFVVGKIPYKTVILPHMYAIEGKTVELLLHFFAAGGQILSVGDFPGYSSGPEARLEALRTCVLHTDRSEVRTRLAEQKRLTLSIAQHGQELETISYLQRETEQGTILFLVNHAKDQSYDAVLTVYGVSSCVTALTAEDGEMHPISYRIAEGNTESCLHFEPMGSHLLLLQPTTVSAYQVEEPQIQTVKMEANWTVERMDLNTL
ncbi:MAG: glycosyl hydrolase, partial [Hungatella sp.]